MPSSESVSLSRVRVRKLGVAAGAFRSDETSDLALREIRRLAPRPLLAQQQHAHGDAEGDPPEPVVRLHAPLEPLARLRGFARLGDEKLEAVLAVQ